MNYIKGIDISHNNIVNFNRLDPSIKFVYCKATQGAGFKDPEFNNYWQYLKGRDDLYRGAYHFLVVGESAEDQANNFLSRGVDFSKPNVLPPMLDIEDQVPTSLNSSILNNKSAFIQLATDWINIVQEKTNRKVIIYSYHNFFIEYLNNHSWSNPLWLASYPKESSPTTLLPPGLPVGYDHYDLWQYTQYGTIDGKVVGGEFDLDYYTGNDLSEL